MADLSALYCNDCNTGVAEDDTKYWCYCSSIEKGSPLPLFWTSRHYEAFPVVEVTIYSVPARNQEEALQIVKSVDFNPEKMRNSFTLAVMTEEEWRNR